MLRAFSIVRGPIRALTNTTRLCRPPRIIYNRSFFSTGISTDERLKQAMDHLQASRLDSAVNELREIQKEKPDHQSVTMLADFLLHLDSKDEALNVMNQAVDAVASKPSAHFLFMRGVVYNSMGNLDNAIKDFNDSLAIEPNNAEALLGVATIYEKQGKSNESRDVFNRVLSASPPAPGPVQAVAYFSRARGLFKEKKIEESLACAEEGITKDPINPFLRHLKAVCLRSLDRLEEALKAYDEVPSNYRDFERACAEKENLLSSMKNVDVVKNHESKAQDYMSNNKIGEALEEWRAIHNLDPSHHTAADLAKWLFKTKQTEEALAVLDKAISYGSAPTELYMWRGLILQSKGEMEKALPDLQLVVKLDPESDAAHLSLATALLELKMLDEALPIYDRLISMQSQLEDVAHYGKSRLYVERGEYEKALESATKACEMSPMNGISLMQKAICLHHLGRNDEAVETIDSIPSDSPYKASAMRLKDKILPGNVSIEERHKRATEYMSTGRNDDAKVEMLHIIAADPAHESVADLALLLAVEKRAPEAIEILNKALEIKPKDSTFLATRGMALQANNELEKALADFELAARENPFHMQSYMGKAAVNRELGKFNEAIAAYDYVIGCDSSAWAASAYMNKWNVLISANRLEDSLQCVNDSLEKWPNYGKMLHQKMVSLVLLNKVEEARSVLQLIPKNDPESNVAEEHFQRLVKGDNITMS